MLVVETIAKIRRAYFIQKKPIKAICRELKVSRKVVRKRRSFATNAIASPARSWEPGRGNSTVRVQRQ